MNRMQILFYIWTWQRITMAHFISSIITTFKYKGDLPYIYLKDNYALIPLSAKTVGFEGDEIEPFYNLTDEIRKLAIA